LIACLFSYFSLSHTRRHNIINFLQTSQTGWPEEFMAGAIAHCRKNAGTKCPATKYFVSIGDNILEQRVVAMPAETMLPDEVVSPVRMLPQGQLPTHETGRCVCDRQPQGLGRE
jgi:hypothetical protein